MHHTKHFAEAVRAACVEVAQRAYEDAGISGLCAEGRWEYALDAIRHFDMTDIIKPFDNTAAP